MKGLLLASGNAQRMGIDKNKGMIPIGDEHGVERPVFEWIVDRMVDVGIDEVVLALGVKKEEVMHHFGVPFPDDYKASHEEQCRKTEEEWRSLPPSAAAEKYRRLGVKFQASISDTLPNTAGEMANARRYLEKEDNFLFQYGDTMTNVDLKKLYAIHKACGAVETFPCMKGMKIEAGVVRFSDNGNYQGTEEKPFMEDILDIPRVKVHVKNVGDFMWPKAMTNIPVYWIGKGIWDCQALAIGNDFNVEVKEELEGKNAVQPFYFEGPQLYHHDIGDLKKYKTSDALHRKGTPWEIPKLP